MMRHFACQEKYHNVVLINYLVTVEVYDIIVFILTGKFGKE